MIEVRNITKRYGHLTAIDRVTFRVDKGEVLAFLGPNGAGKTTTMRILTSFIPATEGSAQVAGFDCAEQPDEVKKRIGYLPETPPVYQELTVAEYLAFVGRLRGFTGTELRSAMERVMERLALGSVQHRLIANLSRGYRQRVGLAQALIHDPPVLILDEPTRGIDVGAKYEIYTLMNKLVAEGMSIVMISSELPEVLGMSDRVYIVSTGRITGELPIEEATQERIMHLATN